MASGQTSQPVNDWQTVEPNDWQTVPATGAGASAPPKPSAVSSGLDRMLGPSDMSGNDTGTLKGYFKTWVELLKGGAAGAKAAFSPPDHLTWNPVEQFRKDFPHGIIWNPITQAKDDWADSKDFRELAEKDPNYAVGLLLGPALLTHAISSLATPAGFAAKITRGTGASDAGMIENTENDLRSAAKAIGKPKTVGEFLDVTSKAQQKLNDEYSTSLGKYSLVRGNLPDVDGNFPLAQKILELKDKYPPGTELSDEARRVIDARAAEFKRPVTLGDLDRDRINYDARRYGLYGKSDVGQYAAKTANVENAIDTTISNWVRDNVYPEMDRLTGKPPGYFRDLKQRTGNLMRIQSEAKDNAVRFHTESMKDRGKTRWERARPGASLSQGGALHAYFPNIPAWLHPEDPEAGANAAIRSAYGIHQRFQPPPEILSLPISALAGAKASSPKGGPKTQALQQARDHGRYAHVAVGPNGHRIGSNDGQTWVDTETGEPVNGQ